MATHTGVNYLKSSSHICEIGLLWFCTWMESPAMQHKDPQETAGRLMETVRSVHVDQHKHTWCLGRSSHQPPCHQRKNNPHTIQPDQAHQNPQTRVNSMPGTLAHNNKPCHPSQDGCRGLIKSLKMKWCGCKTTLMQFTKISLVLTQCPSL